MTWSPKTELFEDGLQSGTFGKRHFPVLVWTRIFLKTDKKIRVDKALACEQALRPSADLDQIPIQSTLAGPECVLIK